MRAVCVRVASVRKTKPEHSLLTSDFRTTLGPPRPAKSNQWTTVAATGYGFRRKRPSYHIWRLSPRGHRTNPLAGNARGDRERTHLNCHWQRRKAREYESLPTPRPGLAPAEMARSRAQSRAATWGPGRSTSDRRDPPISESPSGPSSRPDRSPGQQLRPRSWGQVRPALTARCVVQAGVSLYCGQSRPPPAGPGYA